MNKLDKLIDETLEMFVMPDYREQYRPDLKARLEQSKCPQKHQQLIRLWVEEKFLLKEESMLLRKPEANELKIIRQEAVNPFTNFQEVPCPKCPGKKRKIKT